MRLVVISGHSGSGKSTALHVLEDAGFTCVDNLPASLLPELVNHIESMSPDGKQKFAISIDARNTWQDLKQFPQIINSDQTLGLKCEVVFLDARNSVLIQRFSETRRKHPLSDRATDLQEAIRIERNLLEPIANIADLVIDTSNLSLHELRDLVKIRVAGNEGPGMSILFESFGFKYGLPVDAEIVFDVRCLPNPYWKPHLRTYNGLEKPVIEFLDDQPEVQEMEEDIKQYLSRWLPRFAANNRSYITVAIGCTGGQHRSVYFCDRLFRYFSEHYDTVQVRHRELKVSHSKPSEIASPTRTGRP
ncbi:MAG: RNase adapter RapZ [Cellvibrionaceae bacterium]